MPTLNLGKVRFALQGTWDSATAYAILDAVLYNGSTYTAIAASAAGTVPSSNAAIWQLLAEKGTNGDDGTNGTTFTAGAGLTLSGTTLNCDINTPSEVGLSNLSNNGNNLSGSFTASGNITAYSDERLKSNVEKIPNALDKVLNVRGVTFDMNSERATGVIAQELEKVLPEAVFDNKDGMKSVAYGNIVGLLIEAIKEQQVQINKLIEESK
mgnify:CR=1 FL=1